MTFDRRRGNAPLLTIFGGDVTTARRRAERAVSRLTPFYPMSPRWTAKAAFTGRRFCLGSASTIRSTVRASAGDFLTESKARRLVAAYGTRH